MVDKRSKVAGMAKDKKELKRLKALEQEVLRLTKENDLLKKWQRFLAETHQNAIDSSKETDKPSE